MLSFVVCGILSWEQIRFKFDGRSDNFFIRWWQAGAWPGIYHMVIVTPCPSKECVGFYCRFVGRIGAFPNSCPILECKENFSTGEKWLRRKCEVQFAGPVDGIDWSNLGLYRSWFIRL